MTDRSPRRRGGVGTKLFFEPAMQASSNRMLSRMFNRKKKQYGGEKLLRKNSLKNISCNINNRNRSHSCS